MSRSTLGEPVDMESNASASTTLSSPTLTSPITSFSLGAAPPHMQKWCDRWHKKALKCGITRTKLFPKVVLSPGGAKSYALSLHVVGKPPAAVTWGRHQAEEITEQELREATEHLMKQVGLVSFEF